MIELSQTVASETPAITDEIAAANKDLLRRFYREVHVDWNMALADEVVSPEFRSHDWPAGATGPKAFREYYAAIRSAVPDAHYEVDDMIAEGDRVVVRWRMLGTHKGAFNGIAPTGRAITLKEIAIYRVEDGKLMERWVVSDLHGALQEVRRSARFTPRGRKRGTPASRVSPSAAASFRSSATEIARTSDMRARMQTRLGTSTRRRARSSVGAMLPNPTS
jgi:steroid delta-isomerase-like uncharacterized protein